MQRISLAGGAETQCRIGWRVAIASVDDAKEVDTIIEVI